MAPRRSSRGPGRQRRSERARSLRARCSRTLAAPSACAARASRRIARKASPSWPHRGRRSTTVVSSSSAGTERFTPPPTSRSAPELAILPAGRANNIARALGIPLDLEAAAELAIEGRARGIDLISATTATQSYLAVEGVSVGFHALARTSYQRAELGRRPRRDSIGARCGAQLRRRHALPVDRRLGGDARRRAALRRQPLSLRLRAQGRPGRTPRRRSPRRRHPPVGRACAHRSRCSRGSAVART